MFIFARQVVEILDHLFCSRGSVRHEQPSRTLGGEEHDDNHHDVDEDCDSVLASPLCVVGSRVESEPHVSPQSIPKSNEDATHADEEATQSRRSNLSSVNRSLTGVSEKICRVRFFIDSLIDRKLQAPAPAKNRKAINIPTF